MILTAIEIMDFAVLLCTIKSNCLFQKLRQNHFLNGSEELSFRYPQHNAYCEWEATICEKGNGKIVLLHISDICIS